MSKKKSSVGNLPLAFWVLMLFIVLSISCLIFLMDQNNYKMKKWGQNGIMVAEVDTAVVALQALSDRAEKEEISIVYAKRVGADILEGAGLCALDEDGAEVVACDNGATAIYSVDFKPFGWRVVAK